MFRGFKKSYQSTNIQAWNLSKDDWFRMFGDVYRVKEVTSSAYSHDKMHIVATRATGDPEARYTLFMPRSAELKIWNQTD